jgi:hypothetical protein
LLSAFFCQVCRQPFCSLACLKQHLLTHSGKSQAPSRRPGEPLPCATR